MREGQYNGTAQSAEFGAVLHTLSYASRSTAGSGSRFNSLVYVRTILPPASSMSIVTGPDALDER